MEPSVDRSALLRDVTSGITAAEASSRTDGASAARMDSMDSAELARFITSLRALRAAVMVLGPQSTPTGSGDESLPNASAEKLGGTAPPGSPVQHTSATPAQGREPL